jgi:hypothetical protein
MTTELHAPPSGLMVQFDLHGMHCEVRPKASRPLWMHAGAAMMAAALVGGSVVLGAVAWTLALWWDPRWFAALVPLAFLIAGVTWAFAMDRANTLERLQVRVGEGWLVVRHHAANLLQESEGVQPDLESGQTVVTETERLDLRSCSAVRMISGPMLVIQRLDGSVHPIPMRGHDTMEVLWLATAIGQAIRDAHHGDTPAPMALMQIVAAREPS